MADSSTGDAGLLGKYVTIVNTSRDDVNGSVGLCKTFIPDKQRYAIHVCKGLVPPTEAIMNLKVENLTPAGTMAGKIAEYKMMAVEAAKDPQMKQSLAAFSLMSSELERFLATYGLTIRTFFAGIFGLVSVHFYFRGLMKTLMLFFLVYYPTMFAMPDLRARKSPLQIIRNLPNNIRSQLTVATGRDIPVWAVTGGFVLVWGMGAKVVLSPASAAAVASSHGSIPAAEIDKAYAMGFDDGSAGKPYGTSLPTGPSVGSDASYDSPPPPASSSSPFNFSNLMSLGLLAKFAYEAGSDGAGGWNPVLIVPYVQANPMKAMVPAFGLYRIGKAFLG